MEEAQLQKREANLTALAAIGPRRKRPLEQPESQVSLIFINPAACSQEPSPGTHVRPGRTLACVCLQAAFWNLTSIIFEKLMAENAWFSLMLTFAAAYYRVSTDIVCRYQSLVSVQNCLCVCLRWLCCQDRGFRGGRGSHSGTCCCVWSWTHFCAARSSCTKRCSNFLTKGTEFALCCSSLSLSKLSHLIRVKNRFFMVNLKWPKRAGMFYGPQMGQCYLMWLWPIK